MRFVLAHMIGNLKLFFSKAELNLYGEALRDLPGDLLPAHGAAVDDADRAHRRVRVPHPCGFVADADEPPRPARQVPVEARLRRRRLRLAHDAVDRHHRRRCSSSSTCWISRGAPANPDFVRGDPYNNLVYSFERVPVAIVYILAIIALAFHMYHGAWSMFQSLGINNPKYNARGAASRRASPA